MEIKTARFVISNTDIRKCPQDGKPEYAFIGRSNVGKSSLINMLTRQNKLAMTSATPGKTLLINHFIVNDAWYLVDLPGYGYAKRSKDSKRVWSTLTEDYFVKNPSADALKLVIQLIDIRTGPTDDDILMINWMIDMGVPFLVVATKTDKLSKKQLSEAVESIHNEFFNGTGIEILPFSSVTREGKDELWNKIFDAIK